MRDVFKKLVSTVLVIASISGMSACRMQVSDAPIKIVETQGDEELEKNQHAEQLGEGQLENNLATENNSNSAQEVVEDRYYSSIDQVKTLANAFGAKDDVMYRLAYDCRSNKETIRRFEHKNGEPVKIAIHPSMSQLGGETAIEQVDYVFGLLSQINDKYQYEIVEYVDGEKYDLVFENRDGHWNGLAGFIDDDYYKGTAYTQSAVVYINERAILGAKYSGDTQLNLRNITLHELLHVFGFGDVYVKDTHEMDSTTVMQGSINQNSAYSLTHLTPNDYKNLVSLYAPPSSELEDDIQKYQDMVGDYTHDYYLGWFDEQFSEKMPTKTIENGEYVFNKFVYVDMENKIRDNAEFRLAIEDDKYAFIVTDSKGNILEQFEGNVDFIGYEASKKDYPAVVAYIEGFSSKYIFEDIYHSEAYNGAFSNIVMYYDGEKLVFKDVLGNMNKATPEYQIEEMNIEK